MIIIVIHFLKSHSIFGISPLSLTLKMTVKYACAQHERSSFMFTMEYAELLICDNSTLYSGLCNTDWCCTLSLVEWQI